MYTLGRRFLGKSFLPSEPQCPHLTTLGWTPWSLRALRPRGTEKLHLCFYSSSLIVLISYSPPTPLSRWCIYFYLFL